MPPSVTPRRTAGGSNNPGIRLYKYDNSTGNVSLFKIRTEIASCELDRL